MPHPTSPSPARPGRPSNRRIGRRLALIAAVAALLLSACGRNMYDQPKAELYEALPYDSSRASALLPPENAVSRERGSVDPQFFNAFSGEFPLEVDAELLRRGQERYNIYCSPCHNFNGNGQGMIVQKGYVQPASFHEQRLLDQPPGYFYNAITNGFGRMYSYASRIPPEDRWAIGAYIKALQLSQNAFAEDVPEDVRGTLGAPSAPTSAPSTSDPTTGEVR